VEHIINISSEKKKYTDGRFDRLNDRISTSLNDRVEGLEI
jgi:hypothetical protein